MAGLASDQHKQSSVTSLEPFSKSVQVSTVSCVNEQGVGDGDSHL